VRDSCNLLSKFASRTQIECGWGRWLRQRIVLDCFNDVHVFAADELRVLEIISLSLKFPLAIVLESRLANMPPEVGLPGACPPTPDGPRSPDRGH